MHPDEDDGLWVRSELMPDGTYGVGLTCGPDRAWSLNRDQAITYAVECFLQATEVEHDTAVMRLLVTTLGSPVDAASTLITRCLLPDRPDHHHVTKPLRFTGAIGKAKHPRSDAGQFVPLLSIELDGTTVGQLTPADLRDHAAAVLNAIAAADLDVALHRLLVNQVDLDDQRARAVIGDLSNHWPEQNPPRNR